MIQYAVWSVCDIAKNNRLQSLNKHLTGIFIYRLLWKKKVLNRKIQPFP